MNQASSFRGDLYYLDKYECMVVSHLKPNHHEDVSQEGEAEGCRSEKNQLGNDSGCLKILSGTEQSTHKDSDYSFEQK